MEKRALAVRKHVRLEGCIGDSGVLETGDYCQRQTAEGSRRNSRFKEQPSLRNSRVFAFDQRPRQVAGARNERGRTVSVPNFTFLSTSSAGRSCDRVTFHLVASTDDFCRQTGVNFFRYEFFFLLFLLKELVVVVVLYIIITFVAKLSISLDCELFFYFYFDTFLKVRLHYNDL